MENDVYKFFNEPKNYLHRSFGVQVRADIIKELLPEIRGNNILDAGCGDGGVSLQFLGRNRIVFLDMSEKMLDLVRQRIDSEDGIFNYKLVQGSLSDFNDSEGFDLILTIGLLAHVSSVDDTLSKIRELLLTNGTLVVQFSNFRSWLIKANMILARNYGYSLNRIDYHRFKRQIKAHGFEINKEYRYGLLLPGMGLLPNKWLYRYTSFLRRSGITSWCGTDYIWVVKKR